MRRRGGLRRRLPRERGDRRARGASCRAAALRHALPVCGPNCDGLDLAPLARRALGRRAGAGGAGPRRARLAERQPRRQRARDPPRAAAAHRDLERQRGGGERPPTGSRTSPTEPELRSVALLIEARRRRRAAVRGARRVRRRGRRRRGAEGRRLRGRRRRGRRAHRRGRRRPPRVPRARARRRARRGRTTSTSCSSSPRRSPSAAPARAAAASPSSPARAATPGLGADEAERLGLELPAFAPATVGRAARAPPRRRHDRQPARLHGADLGRPRVAARPRRARRRGPRRRPGARLLRPPARARGRLGRELAGGRGRHPRRRRARARSPVLVAATLPELLDDAAAWRFAEAGVPAVAGLRTGLACAAALAGPAARRRPPARDGRRREPLTTPAGRTPACGSRWLAEHEAKALLRAAGDPRRRRPHRRRRGRRGRRARRARRPGRGQGSRAPTSAHKAAAGAARARRRRRARRPRRLRARSTAAARCSSSGWRAPGVELIVSVRRDAVVPALVIGLGGIYAEAARRRRRRPAPRRRPRASSAAIAELRGARAARHADLAAAARLAAAPRRAARPRADRVQPRPRPSRRRRRRRRRRQGDRRMNAIAEQLGEVGLPAPVKELAARHWDAVIVGGGHNGLTCAAYLAQGRPVGARARAPRAARRRVHARAPVRRPGLRRQPLRLRRRPARRASSSASSSSSERGLHVHVADPNLWVPFEDGTSFGQWLDDARTQRRPRRARRLASRTRRATGPTSTSSTRSAGACAPASATAGSATRPRRAELEELLHGEQTMIDVVFDASIAEVLDDHMDDQRLKDALFGQGVIGAWAGPHDKGTASIKLMHYQGDLEGRRPAVGLRPRRHGDDLASRSPTPRRRPAPRSPPASPSPRSCPTRACGSRTAR